MTTTESKPEMGKETWRWIEIKIKKNELMKHSEKPFVAVMKILETVVRFEGKYFKEYSYDESLNYVTITLFNVYTIQPIIDEICHKLRNIITSVSSGCDSCYTYIYLKPIIDIVMC